MARILLVDDEDCILRSTAILLETEGHTTVCVLNGHEAQTQLECGTFDLMVTDIRMAPVDGMELLRWSRDARPAMPVIVISAYGSDKTARECLALGARKYMKKPFRMDQIMKAINEVLSAGPAA